MAAAIKARTGVDVELAEGARGAFEVLKDGVAVFSKLKVGRFPNGDDEVLRALG